MIGRNEYSSARSKRRHLAIALIACPLLVTGCQPKEILYQVVEFVALSEALKDAKVELFERGETGNDLLTEFGIPKLVPKVAGLDTVRVSAGPITVEHLHTETYSWSWCMSVWAFVNNSDHEITIDTNQCVMVNLDDGKLPRKPYALTQRLNGKAERYEVMDGKPLQPNEAQVVPATAKAWPKLTIPPKGKSAVAFSYQSWHSKHIAMDIELRESNSDWKYHYQFKLSK